MSARQYSSAAAGGATHVAIGAAASVGSRQRFDNDHRRQAVVERPRSGLTPQQFKSLVYSKGWTLKQLATHWDLAPETVSRLANDPQRSSYWNDAAHGLAVIGPRRKPRGAWSGGCDFSVLDDALSQRAAIGPAAAAGAGYAEPKPRPVPKVRGYRYHGYMVVGAVVAASKYLGEIADEGQRGIVLEVMREPSQETYRVIFEMGDVEMFSPDQVDEYLVTTGLERSGLSGYVWRGEQAARHDFDAGLFVFDEALDAPNGG